MVGRFVIPTDDYGQDWRRGLARIISLRMKGQFRHAYVTLSSGKTNGLLVEVAHALVLLRHSHCFEVVFIADGLEIATDQEQIYFVLLLGF
jgi:hypothetical protein